MGRRISIIVPVYNEAEGIENFIRYLKDMISESNAELILIDGGSSDETVRLCKENDAAVYKSAEKGRAAQMNYGAKKATGDIYYFLHSDSLPPENFIKHINKNITQGFSSGCYRLSFTPDHFLLRLYSWFTRFDINLFRFGDQSLFVDKKVFERVGGFSESLVVMEDQQIVRDIRKISDFVIMNDSVITSSRKYFKNGVFKLQLIFAIIVLLYYLGIDQKVITNFYSRQLKSVL